MESVGFKEWALVCEALGRGEQKILLRKGGIAEGRGGFQFEHPEFFLFPTFFHEQIDLVRIAGSTLPQALPDEIELRFFAQVQRARLLVDWEEVCALAPSHVLKESVVRERFHAGETPGVHVAWVKVFRLDPVWRFPNEKRFGGCRSWVKLPPIPADLRLAPVTLDRDAARA